jgi:hypothetical protein
MEDTTNQPIIPPAPADAPKKSSSWGVIIAILIILGMMVVGAFYAWGKRVNQGQAGYTTSLPQV